MMFKLITVSSFLALALVCLPASAQTAAPVDQTAPPEPGPPPGAASGDGAAPTPGAGQGMKPPGAVKELVAACKSDAKGKGLRGDELKKAVNDCVALQRPDVAARRQCHEKGKSQGLSGPELKTFVRNCKTAGGNI
jgi:hypothetical protein